MFEDRKDAARQLVRELKKYQQEDTVVMAIPRGGVPLGFEVANELDCPLDIAMTKKIGHPENPEYAIGSVSLSGEVLDLPVREIDRDWVETEKSRIRQQLQESYHRYAGDREPVTTTGKTVIIVDDGIATGRTMQATIELMRRDQPARLVLAIPVAPPRAVRRLESMVDEIICLEKPDDFRAVGQFYNDFSQVSDDEVVDNLHGRVHEESRL